MKFPAVHWVEWYSFVLRLTSWQAKHAKRGKYPALLKLVHRHAQGRDLTANVTPHTFRRRCTTELIRDSANP
jgi:integrase